MEILSQLRQGRLELELQGRFDANWAEHVGNAIESAIRAGHHQIDLDLLKVNYLSSAGVRVLVKYFKRLSDARGALRIVGITEAVLSVLQLSGLAPLLVAGTPTADEAQGRRFPAASGHPQDDAQRWQRNGVVFELYEQLSGGVLDGQLHGRPEDFTTGQLSSAQSNRVRFEADAFGLGLGAFGGGPDEARGRFGEFLAAAGTAVTQPTDGSSVPDFLVTESRFVPEVNLLYGITARGRFSRLLRFEAGSSDRRVVALSELVEAALENMQISAAGFTILAESAGVVGATLRQSPALAAGRSPWNFPEVRDWLSFTTERADDRSVVLIVGFADREPLSDTARFLRRMGPNTPAQGHFHAAVFPYRPLPKGNLDLKESVAGLLATESAQGVLHLLADEREFEGVGQTDLMRGACWVGPLRLPVRRPPT